MATEVWKKIDGWGRYNVSNFGNIKNIETGYILKPHPCTAGYTSVVLTPMYEGDYRRFRSHRLVASAFLPNPENLPEVDHIDRARNNNHVSNLRWVTKKQNAANKRTRIVGNRHLMSIWKCDKNTGERIEFFESATLAANSVIHKSKTPESSILKAARGDNANAYGYKWEYDDEEEIEGEVWKEVDPFLVNQPVGEKTNYLISSMGRLRDPLGRTRLPFLNDYGYSLFTIMGHAFLAHRLIAFTFLERIPGKDNVNHIDGDRTNCSLSNLEFVTQSENAIHAFETGLNPRVYSVCQYEISGKFVKKYISIAEAARQMKVFQSPIHKALSSGRTCCGFQWKLYENNTDDIQPIVPYIERNYICQYTLSGKYVRDYESAGNAGREMGVNSNAILNVIYKQGSTSANFQWRKKNSDIPVTDLTKRKNVKQMTLDGTFIAEYSSVKQASENTDFKYDCIRRSTKSGKPYKGFKWVHVSEEESKKRKRNE